MLNNQLKNEAVEKLERSIKSYDKIVVSVKRKARNLFSIRQNSGEEVLTPVEDFINKLTNSPKKYDQSFSVLKLEFNRFNHTIKKFEEYMQKNNLKRGVGLGTTTTAALGTAAFMPTAAMAIATTFGTASTGTAIATLTGAAATNAALAWLGGGAIAAGGAGIAGGSAFLALAGPIGIGIGVVGFIGSGLFASSKNKEIAQEANHKRKKIVKSRNTIKAQGIEIDNLINLTKEHQESVLKILSFLSETAPSDFINYTREQKDMLGAMVNHIQSLSILINTKI